jgi:leucyl-tRNA synthetase
MILGENNEKMSKARGNVVNPDSVVSEYGADSLRLYEMFMGPLEQSKPWSMQGVNGVYGFLNRAWRLIMDERAEDMRLNAAIVDRPPTADENRELHKTIGVVTDHIAGLQFNTAISRMMEFTNYFTPASERPRSAMEQFVLLLSPFAPHIAEELWQALGHTNSLAHEPWPEFNPALAKEDLIEIPVQIDGKVRLKIKVPADANDEQIVAKAKTGITAIEWWTGQNLSTSDLELKKVVTGRLVSFVVRQ